MQYNLVRSVQGQKLEGNIEFESTELTVCHVSSFKHTIALWAAARKYTVMHTRDQEYAVIGSPDKLTMFMLKVVSINTPEGIEYV